MRAGTHPYSVPVQVFSLDARSRDDRSLPSDRVCSFRYRLDNYTPFSPFLKHEFFRPVVEAPGNSRAGAWRRAFIERSAPHRNTEGKRSEGLPWCQRMQREERIAPENREDRLFDTKSGTFLSALLERSECNGQGIPGRETIGRLHGTREHHGEGVVCEPDLGHAGRGRLRDPPA